MIVPDDRANECFDAFAASSLTIVATIDASRGVTSTFSKAQDVDSIATEKITTGKYDLTGSALTMCGEASHEVSVSIEGEPYETYEQAESAGLAWAERLGVQILYQETLVGQGFAEGERSSPRD